MLPIYYNIVRTYRVLSQQVSITVIQRYSLETAQQREDVYLYTHHSFCTFVHEVLRQTVLRHQRVGGGARALQLHAGEAKLYGS